MGVRGHDLVGAASGLAGRAHEQAEASGTAFQGLEHIVGDRLNFIDQERGWRIWELVVDTLDIAARIGGAAEEEAALPVTELGFKPLPAGKSWSEPEAAQ